MAITKESIVADVVLAHPECARVFSAHKIDYCCGGKTSVERACATRGLEPQGLLAALDAAVAARANGPRESDPRAQSTPALIARVVDEHHAYLREVMPSLAPLAAKVARVHGEHDPRLRSVSETLQALFATLGPHLDEEEALLFPAMMAAAARRPSEAMPAMLAAMTTEHQEVGARLATLRELTDGFSPPTWACTSYRTLLRELSHLEQDTHHHVHLENNVLAPRFERSDATNARSEPAEQV